MPRITNISVQNKNNNRVNVSVDGEYKFSLDIYQVSELKLKIGVELSESEIGSLQDESEYGKLYVKAVDYCAVRPRSTKEVKDYLHKKTRPTLKRNAKTGKIVEKEGINQQIAERVLERLIQKKYLDDEKFAQFWVEHRFVKRGASARRLKIELSQKGINQEEIEKTISKNIRSDKEEIEKIISKKIYRYKDKQKFIQYLMRQGFSYADVTDALSGKSFQD